MATLSASRFREKNLLCPFWFTIWFLSLVFPFLIWKENNTTISSIFFVVFWLLFPAAGNSFRKKSSSVSDLLLDLCLVLLPLDFMLPPLSFFRPRPLELIQIFLLSHWVSRFPGLKLLCTFCLLKCPWRAINLRSQMSNLQFCSLELVGVSFSKLAV